VHACGLEYPVVKQADTVTLNQQPTMMDVPERNSPACQSMLAAKAAAKRGDFRYGASREKLAVKSDKAASPITTAP